MQIIRVRKADDLADDVCLTQDWRIVRNELRKRSGYHLIGLIGIPLVVAVCLLLQLHKLPDSSLSYSILNAIVSVLFNFSSSALLKVFPFLFGLLGLSKWTTAR